MGLQVKYVFESPTKEELKKKKKGKESLSGKSDASDGEYDLPRSRHSSPDTSSDSGLSVMDVTEERKGESIYLTAHDHDHLGRPYASPKPSQANLAPDDGSHHGSLHKYCGLCASYHGPMACPMTMDTISLSEYRKLIIYKSTEPYEMRVSRHLDSSLRVAYSNFFHTRRML